MPVNETKLDEVRRLIISLVLARKSPPPLSLLDNDYYEAENERIPFRRFGYMSLVEFLESMPNHFVLEYRNGLHYVRGIPTEKSKHVSSLVSRQKSSQKKPYLSSSSSYRRPNYSNAYSNSYSSAYSHVRNRIRIPADKLNYLTQYVKNYPEGITIQSALEIIQKQLPHVTLSSHDIQTQLRELSHQVYIDGKMIRPVQSRSDHQNYSNYQFLSTPLEPQDDGARSSDAALYTVAGDESELTDNESNEAGTFTKYHYKQRDGPSVNRKQTPTSYDNNYDFESCVDTESTHKGVSSLISDRIRSRLEKLIQKNPDGIWSSELPNKYLEEYNVPLNYTDLGFSSIRDYISYLPDVFYIMRQDEKADYILYSANRKSSDYEETPEVQSTAAMEEVERSQDVPQSFDEDNTAVPYSADLSPSTCTVFIPDNVMTYGESVNQILVTNLHNPQSTKTYYEVYVVEVYNPSFFWIHLRKNKSQFNTFMSELQEFYQQNSERYVVPRIVLKRGLNCVCLYAGMWHRGIIKTVKPDFKIMVMLYDYGTQKIYEAEDIHYLHKQFSHLPIQAIPCGLFNVKPCIGDRWKKSITDRFIDRIEDTLMMAEIVSVDPPNNSMMIVLTDTSEEVDVHINDWFVEENLALRGKMGDAVDMASLLKYVVNSMNQLPTYCFAEESLIVDRSLSKEEPSIKETTSISPGLNSTYRDNPSTLKPPPGFASLNVSDVPNTPTDVLNTDVFSLLGNPSSAKTPSVLGNVTESSTNPFLDNYTTQPTTMNFMDILSEPKSQMYMQIFNENLQLQIKLIDLFRDLLTHSLTNKNMFENYFTMQFQFNKILKTFINMVTIDNGQSFAAFQNGNTNSADAMTPSNLNNDNFAKQEATSSTCFSGTKPNPFGDTSYTYKPSHNSMFSSDSSNLVYQNCTRDTIQSTRCVNTNWDQTSDLSLHIQVPPNSVPLTYNNYGNAAGIVYSSTDINKNVPLMKGASNINILGIDGSSSGFSRDVNIDFVNMQHKSEDTSMKKETNPFKLSMAGKVQIPETQNKNVNGYDTIPKPQLTDMMSNCVTKMPEDANIQSTNYNFCGTYENSIKSESKGDIASMGHNVNVNGDNGYASKIVCEADPAMYNMQRQQMKTDAVQQPNRSCNYNSNSVQNTFYHLRQFGNNRENLTAHPTNPTNRIDALQVEHNALKMIYEHSPLVYNTQWQQTKTDTVQQINKSCNYDLNGFQNASFQPRQCGNKREQLLAQPINSIASQPEHNALRMVYEGDPVMYNTQWQQTKTDTVQQANKSCNYDLNGFQNASFQLRQCGNKREQLPVQSMNSIDASQLEHNAPKIVYEAGPVMYNTQQTKTDTVQQTNKSCNNYNRDSVQNASFQLRQFGSNKEQLPAQHMNSIDASQLERNTNKPHLPSPSGALGTSVDATVSNNDGYVTTPNMSTNTFLPMQNEANYYQQQGVNTRKPWQHMETWVTSKFQDMSLQSHNKGSASSFAMSKSTDLLPHNEWDKSKEAVAQNGTINSNHASQQPDRNGERAMYVSSWNPSSIESQRYTDHRSTSSYSNSVSLKNSFMFHRIDSIKDVNILFHIEGDGWISTYEFVKAFTRFKSFSHFISALEKINITAKFKDIKRSDYPAQFLQLDSYPLNTSRDSDDRIVLINLISLPTMLGILYRLKIIVREELENAFKRGESVENSTMHKILTLINKYKAFKQNVIPME